MSDTLGFYATIPSPLRSSGSIAHVCLLTVLPTLPSHPLPFSSITTSTSTGLPHAHRLHLQGDQFHALDGVIQAGPTLPAAPPHGAAISSTDQSHHDSTSMTHVAPSRTHAGQLGRHDESATIFLPLRHPASLLCLTSPLAIGG
jgi:hypothetical protein